MKNILVGVVVARIQITCKVVYSVTSITGISVTCIVYNVHFMIQFLLKFGTHITDMHVNTFFFLQNHKYNTNLNTWCLFSCSFFVKSLLLRKKDRDMHIYPSHVIETSLLFILTDTGWIQF